jgi:hypothetical protein
MACDEGYEMTEATIRWKWLNGMYIYTAVGAGSLGVAMLLAPHLVVAYLQMPNQDPMVFGVVGSAYVAFAMTSILGLRFPLRFVPVLILQLIYKLVWLVAVFLPTLISGTTAAYAWVFAAIFLSYVIGDFIAIPFRQLLAQEFMKA